MIDPSKFKSPEGHCYPGYFWVTDSKMELPELKAQLHDFAEHGAKSVCLHPEPKRWSKGSNMEPDYLTEDWFRIITELVKECHKTGMNWYMYDEGGFPSGGANGLVYDTNPEKFVRKWAVRDGANGYKIMEEEITPSTRAPVPNLLEKGVTERFIELTHKGYAKTLKPYFGNTIRYTFMDEPVMPGIYYGDRLGWCSDLLEEFKKRKGYNLEPWIPVILKREGYGTVSYDAGGKACADYHDVVSALYVERFLTPIRDWCRENGLLSGGHFGGEDEWFYARHCGYGHIVRSLRYLDLPGVDMIWRQLYPGKRLHPFPKLASSVAHQAGRYEVLGEMFAVYGAGLQPDVMKYLIDYMFLCGVNHFVFSNRHAGYNSMEAGGCRPHFGPGNPLWKYFNLIHTYAARFAYLLTQGRSVTDTLLYFDMRAAWIGMTPTDYAMLRSLKAADLLLESQRDFDYTDDEALLNATFANGKLTVGKMSYSTLVIPEDSKLLPETTAKVEEFRRAGLRVLDIDSIEEASQTVQLAPATRAIRVSKLDMGDGCMLYYLFNTTNAEHKETITFAEKGPVCKADGETAEFYAVPSENGVLTWTFAPWESCCFLINYKGEIKPMPAKPSAVVKTLQSWTLKPVTQYVVDGKLCRIVPLDIDPVEAVLGDWCDSLGKNYSGDVIYRTEFNCKDPEKCKFLDLGKVLYSCSVRVNGKDAGMKFWGPYVFPVAGLLKQGTNVIEVTVTNTFANAVNAPGVLEQWSGKKHPSGMCKVSYYEPMLRLFEKDSMESGLFGPVRLMK